MSHEHEQQILRQCMDKIQAPSRGRILFNSQQGDDAGIDAWFCLDDTWLQPEIKERLQSALDDILQRNQKRIVEKSHDFAALLTRDSQQPHSERGFFTVRPRFQPRCVGAIISDEAVDEAASVDLLNMSYHIQRHDDPTEFDSYFECDSNATRSRSIHDSHWVSIPVTSLCLVGSVRGVSVTIPLCSWGLTDVPVMDYLYYLRWSPRSLSSIARRERWEVHDPVWYFCDERVWKKGTISKVFEEGILGIVFMDDDSRFRNVGRMSNRLRPVVEEDDGSRIIRVAPHTRSRRKPIPPTPSPRIVIEPPSRTTTLQSTHTHLNPDALMPPPPGLPSGENLSPPKRDIRASLRRFNQIKRAQDAGKPIPRHQQHATHEEKLEEIDESSLTAGMDPPFDLTQLEVGTKQLYDAAEEAHNLGHEIELSHFKNPRHEFCLDAVPSCEFAIEDIRPTANPDIIKCRMTSWHASKPMDGEFYLTKPQIFSFSEPMVVDWDDGKDGADENGQTLFDEIGENERRGRWKEYRPIVNIDPNLMSDIIDGLGDGEVLVDVHGDGRDRPSRVCRGVMAICRAFQCMMSLMICGILFWLLYSHPIDPSAPRPVSVSVDMPIHRCVENMTCWDDICWPVFHLVPIVPLVVDDPFEYLPNESYAIVSPVPLSLPTVTPSMPPRFQSGPPSKRMIPHVYIGDAFSPIDPFRPCRYKHNISAIVVVCPMDAEVPAIQTDEEEIPPLRRIVPSGKPTSVVVDDVYSPFVPALQANDGNAVVTEEHASKLRIYLDLAKVVVQEVASKAKESAREKIHLTKEIAGKMRKQWNTLRLGIVEAWYLGDVTPLSKMMGWSR